MKRVNSRTLDDKASSGPAEGMVYHRLSSQASESDSDGTETFKVLSREAFLYRPHNITNKGDLEELDLREEMDDPFERRCRAILVGRAVKVLRGEAFLYRPPKYHQLR